MSGCAKCKKPFSEDFVVVCNVCNDLFHTSATPNLNCSGLAATEINALKLKKKEPFVFYKCEKCRSGDKQNPMANLLTELQTKLESYGKFEKEFNEFKQNKLPAIESDLDRIIQDNVLINDRLAQLEAANNANNATKLSDSQSSATNSVNNASQDSNFQHAVSELQERQNRLVNILLYNVEELSSVDDLKVVTKIFEPFKLSTKFTLRNIKRIGKKANNTSKHRPIVITMEKRSDVTTVLGNWKAIPNNYKVSPDLTLLQRNLLKKLKQEATEWNSKNPDNRKIAFLSRGNPVIVFAKPPKTNSSASKSDDNSKN